MSGNKQPILSLTNSDWDDFLASHNQPRFRKKQIIQWLYEKKVTNPELMTNLSLPLRTLLTEQTLPFSSKIIEKLSSEDGTTKLLLELSDNETIEMVVIPSPERITFCLSTQVGCPVRCNFCASGKHGLKRNLSSTEILEQLYHGMSQIGNELPDNIVFMGIGEGLLNFENLLTAAEVMTSAEYLNMSPRRITISTSGYVPNMYRLADLGKPFNLAISLHAVNDEIRAKLIPDALRFPVAEILNAADYYNEKVGRMVTFEYTMLKDYNDTYKDAIELAALAKRHHAKINLIPYNTTIDSFERPSPRRIKEFHEAILERYSNVTLRFEKGSKVAAACGQLRAKKIEQQQ